MFQNLSALSSGQLAQVKELSARGAMRRRFQDLGLIPGTVVECLGSGPLGDPSAYLIRGAVIALRRRDAQSILVDPPYAPQPEALPLNNAMEREAGYGAF